MRISIDCRYIGKSGIGSYIENIVYEFLFHHPEHDYVLIVENLQKQYLHLNNVEQIVTDVAPFSMGEFHLSPIKRINECDLFFTPYINIPWGIKIPIYSTIHDVLFLDKKEIVSKFGYLIRRFFLHRTIKKSEVVFTVSDFSKQRIKVHFPKCNEKKIIVAYNGITHGLSEYARIHSDVVKKNNIVCVGNVKPHKGLDILLNAYREAQKKGLDDKLIIIGKKDNFRTSNLQVYRQCENDDNIIFTGYLNENDMFSILASARVLVSPSRYEGFGIPPLEALYMGTNVILSDIDVYRELYEDFPVTYFKDGNVYDLAEKLLKKETNISCDLRDKLLSKFSYSETADSILDVFKL